MAYENLLSTATKDRDSWAVQQAGLEDEVRVLTIRNAEAERRMLEHLETLTSAIKGAHEAYASLEAEYRTRRDSDALRISELQSKVATLEVGFQPLYDEIATLQAQLAELKADSALKADALRRVAELESIIEALQQRAKSLVADLERDKTAAEQRAEALAADLAATRQALADQASKRASSDDTALRLALERQRLAAALELEQLINEPLRRTHYATSTTLAHVMRSAAAPTVRDRSARPQALHSAASPHYYATPTRNDSVRAGRPGGIPAGAGASFSFSPGPGAGAGAGAGAGRAQLDSAVVSRPDMTASLTGNQLIRLGRSWATTTATAGPPNPAFLDNLNSPISPPPPGPSRRRPASAAATAAASTGGHGAGSTGGGGGAYPPYSPFYVPPAPGTPSGPGGGDRTSVAFGRGTSWGSPEPLGAGAAGAGLASAGGAASASLGGVLGDASEYVVPRHLTGGPTQLRSSFRTPTKAQGTGRSGSTGGGGGASFGGARATAPLGPSWTAGGAASPPGTPGSPSRPGRQAMRTSIKAGLDGFENAEDFAATRVYG